jgi:acetate kinase
MPIRQKPALIHLLGHRVVHGGTKFVEPIEITADVRSQLQALSELAPEHNPINLQGIDAATEMFPDVPQVAVFDTAFHSSMPPAAVVYGTPYNWFEELGIRRFGFHGISHQYAAERCLQLLPILAEDFRLIVCHLGNGASLCAVQDGKSIDTTMGYTPLEGVVMGSRSGSIDPGIVLHLLRMNKYSVEQLDQILNHESGLKGISGISNDLRDILSAMEQGNERAQLAFDVYIHSLCRAIGQMLASLGGVRCLAFTGGVGEHQPIVREAVCEQLQFLNVELDDIANYASAPDSLLSTPNSALPVVLIKSRETYEIARQVLGTVG